MTTVFVSNAFYQFFVEQGRFSLLRISVYDVEDARQPQFLIDTDIQFVLLRRLLYPSVFQLMQQIGLSSSFDSFSVVSLKNHTMQLFIIVCYAYHPSVSLQLLVKNLIVDDVK